MAERIAEGADPDPVTGCMVWRGTHTAAGYGILRVNGKPLYTHRLAYELEHGALPPGVHVLHRCDNPPCINASGGHLFAGSDADNVRDMLAKGRDNSASSKNRKKTHCPSGHEYAGENLLVHLGANGRPRRACRECSRQRSLAWDRSPGAKLYKREWASTPERREERRVYRESHEEYHAAWGKQHREKNKDRIAAQRKQYREKNLDKIRADKKRRYSEAKRNSQPTTKETIWQPSTSMNLAQPSSPSTSSPTGETLTSAF